MKTLAPETRFEREEKNLILLSLIVFYHLSKQEWCTMNLSRLRLEIRINSPTYILFNLMRLSLVLLTC